MEGNPSGEPEGSRLRIAVTEMVMEKPPFRPTPSGAARLRERRQTTSKLWLKQSLLILAILAVFGLGVVSSGNATQWLRKLYSPFAVIIVTVLVVQYILLKGRDRSRLYRMEIDQLRERRREDSDFLQEMEEELRKLDERLAPSEPDSPESPSGDSSQVASARARIQSLRKKLAQKL